MACSVEGCARPRWARGFCSTHYARWRKHGDPLVTLRYAPVPPDRRRPRPRTPAPPKPCSIEGCERPRAARGYCDLHYRRYKKHGDPLVTLRPGPSSCAAEGCDRIGDNARGYCAKHYYRWRKHGDPSLVTRQVKTATVCVICGAPERARGWCAKHYEQWRAHGDPLAADNRPRRRCSVADCDRAPRRRGLCSPHYLREYDRPAFAYQAHTAAVLEAAGGICALCGYPVDESPLAPWPLRPSLDHVVPSSAGGTDELENLRLAHISCNARRRDRADVHETPPPSELAPA